MRYARSPWPCRSTACWSKPTRPIWRPASIAADNEPAYVVDTAAELARVKGRLAWTSWRQRRPRTSSACSRSGLHSDRCMSSSFTLLGSGSSGGVPRVGPCGGACDPSNPKNRRRRCALLIDRFAAGGRTTVLVDTAPDLREQLLDACVETLDGVLYTHDHADHTHGIDDLRGVSFTMRSRVPSVARRPDAQRAGEPLRLLLRPKPGSILYSADPASRDASRRRRRSASRALGGRIEAVPILQLHGDRRARLSLRRRRLLARHQRAFRLLPCRCCRASTSGSSTRCAPMPHPSHFSVKQALEWIGRLGVKRAILTHMTIDLDYETLRRQLHPTSSQGMTAW